MDCSLVLKGLSCVDLNPEGADLLWSWGSVCGVVGWGWGVVWSWIIHWC